MQNRANKNIFWVKWDKIRISAKDQVVPVECPILGWQDGNGNGNRGANGSEKAAAQKQGERWILVEIGMWGQTGGLKVKPVFPDPLPHWEEGNPLFPYPPYPIPNNNHRPLSTHDAWPGVFFVSQISPTPTTKQEIANLIYG